jgi:hypothetical protein
MMAILLKILLGKQNVSQTSKKSSAFIRPAALVSPRLSAGAWCRKRARKYILGKMNMGALYFQLLKRPEPKTLMLPV